ncbi:MAG: PAS domain S-box protein, partial [Proteobacteria bacterium]|nr:PAS domain S-box protein [Pseudomonadota bacterium]
MDLLEACGRFPGLLDQIIGNVRQGLFLIDSQGRILYASQAAQEVLGYRPEEMTGRDLSLIFTPEDLAFYWPNLLFMARLGEPFDGEALLLRRNGTRFFALINLDPILDAPGDNRIILFGIHDIDRQKRLEKTFREGQFEDLIKVANGVAHEIRNPLVGVGGFVNRLYKAAPDSGERDKYYEYIIGSLRRIEDLLKQVDFLVSLPAPYYAEEDMRGLVDLAAEPLLPDLAAGGIEFVNQVEPLPLVVDKTLIVRSLAALFRNAMDAMPDGGTLRVESRVEIDTASIRVSDTGSGIGPDDLGFIFNPFFSTKANGAGIDLAVVKRIAEGHG